KKLHWVLTPKFCATICGKMGKPAAGSAEFCTVNFTPPKVPASARLSPATTTREMATLGSAGSPPPPQPASNATAATIAASRGRLPVFINASPEKIERPFDYKRHRITAESKRTHEGLRALRG